MGSTQKPLPPDPNPSFTNEVQKVVTDIATTEAEIYDDSIPNPFYDSAEANFLSNAEEQLQGYLNRHKSLYNVK